MRRDIPRPRLSRPPDDLDEVRTDLPAAEMGVDVGIALFPQAGSDCFHVGQLVSQFKRAFYDADMMTAHRGSLRGSMRLASASKCLATATRADAPLGVEARPANRRHEAACSLSSSAPSSRLLKRVMPRPIPFRTAWLPRSAWHSLRQAFDGRCASNCTRRFQPCGAKRNIADIDN